MSGSTSYKYLIMVKSLILKKVIYSQWKKLLNCIDNVATVCPELLSLQFEQNKILILFYERFVIFDVLNFWRFSFLTFFVFDVFR